MKTRFLFSAIVSMLVMLSSCKKEDVEVILQGLFDSNYVDAFDCSASDTLQSISGTPSLYIRFENRSSDNIKIDWINFNGDLQTYKESLIPGDDYIIQSFRWHYWQVSDSEGDCIGVYAANDLLQTNVITFQDR